MQHEYPGGVVALVQLLGPEAAIAQANAYLVGQRAWGFLALSSSSWLVATMQSLDDVSDALQSAVPDLQCLVVQVLEATTVQSPEVEGWLQGVTQRGYFT